MKIKTYIIDDNVDDIKRVQEVLDSSDIEFVYESYTNFDASLNYSDVDLFILDIDMPAINGFDLAEKIYAGNSKPYIIFCSSHDDFVYESLMLNPFYFVRKNHLNDDFNMAFNKLKQNSNYNNETYTLNDIHIQLSRIMFFEIDRNKLKIFLNNGEILEERKTMKTLINELKDKDYFLPIHNSFLVNMNYINDFNNTTISIDSYELPVSRSKYTEANKKYRKFKMRKDL